MLRRLVAQALEAQGHTVRTVADGRRALEELSRSEARLIALINFHLPVFSGWHFIQLLAADDHQFGLHAFIFLDVARDVLLDDLVERRPSTFFAGVPAPISLAAIVDVVRRAEEHLGRLLPFHGPEPDQLPDQLDAASASPAQT